MRNIFVKAYRKIKSFREEFLFFTDKKYLKNGLKVLEEKLNIVFSYQNDSMVDYLKRGFKNISYYFNKKTALRDLLIKNFLVIDDTDIYGKNWHTGFGAFPRLKSVEDDSSYFSISFYNNIYKKLPDKVELMREIFFDKEDDMIIIKDRAGGEAHHKVKLILEFNPFIKIKALDNKGEFELSGLKDNMYMKIFSDNFDILPPEGEFIKKITAEKYCKLPIHVYTFINFKNKNFRSSLLELDEKYMKNW